MGSCFSHTIEVSWAFLPYVMETELHKGAATPLPTDEKNEESPGDVGRAHTEDPPAPMQSETKIVVEVVDARVEVVRHRKYERAMARTLRWPIHSNTPRVTF